MAAGMLALTPAVVRKTPKYRTPELWTKPWISLVTTNCIDKKTLLTMSGSPTKQTRQLKTRTGPLICHLSPAHEVVNIKIPAKAYGGATKHCEAPIENPIFSWRMMGKKYAMA